MFGKTNLVVNKQFRPVHSGNVLHDPNRKRTTPGFSSVPSSCLHFLSQDPPFRRPPPVGWTPRRGRLLYKLAKTCAVRTEPSAKAKLITKKSAGARLRLRKSGSRGSRGRRTVSGNRGSGEAEQRVSLRPFGRESKYHPFLARNVCPPPSFEEFRLKHRQWSEVPNSSVPSAERAATWKAEAWSRIGGSLGC